MQNPFPSYQQITAEILTKADWKKQSEDKGIITLVKNGYMAVLSQDNIAVYTNDKKEELLVNVKHPHIMRNPFYSFFKSTDEGIDQATTKNEGAVQSEQPPDELIHKPTKNTP